MTKIRKYGRGRNNAITKEAVAHVKALLDFSVPREEIKERTGVAISTIYRISAGKIEGADAACSPRSKFNNFVRCPECGGKVLMPCALCEYGESVVNKEDEFKEGHIRFALAKHFDIAEEEVTVKDVQEQMDSKEIVVDGKVLLVFKRLGDSIRACHND